MAIQYLTLSLNSFWPIIPTLSHFLHPYPILSSRIVNDVDVITTNASTSLSYLELVKEDWQMFEKTSEGIELTNLNHEAGALPLC